MIEMDSTQLSDYIKAISKSNERELVKELKTFLAKEGKQVAVQTRKNAKSSVRTKTGRYHKSIKKGKVYKFEGEVWAVRAYSTAPHAHLIEYGHKIKGPDGRTKGFVRGKGIFRKTQDKYSKTYTKNVEKWVDDVLDRGFGF